MGVGAAGAGSAPRARILDDDRVVASSAGLREGGPAAPTPAVHDDSRASDDECGSAGLRVPLLPPLPLPLPLPCPPLPPLGVRRTGREDSGGWYGLPPETLGSPAWTCRLAHVQHIKRPLATTKTHHTTRPRITTTSCMHHDGITNTAPLTATGNIYLLVCVSTNKGVKRDLGNGLLLGSL